MGYHVQLLQILSAHILVNFPIVYIVKYDVDKTYNEKYLVKFSENGMLDKKSVYPEMYVSRLKNVGHTQIEVWLVQQGPCIGCQSMDQPVYNQPVFCFFFSTINAASNTSHCIPTAAVSFLSQYISTAGRIPSSTLNMVMGESALFFVQPVA